MTFDVAKYEFKKIDIHDIAEVEYIIPLSNDGFYIQIFVYIIDHYFVMFNYFGGDFVFLDRQGIHKVQFQRWGKDQPEYLPYYWLQIYDEY